MVIPLQGSAFESSYHDRFIMLERRRDLCSTKLAAHTFQFLASWDDLRPVTFGACPPLSPAKNSIDHSGERMLGAHTIFPPLLVVKIPHKPHLLWTIKATYLMEVKYHCHNEIFFLEDIRTKKKVRCSRTTRFSLFAVFF